MPLQSTSGAASYDAFGGGVAAVPKYIEDYFSTFLYQGTGSAQTINNEIDLSTKGGLVWFKSRSGAYNHALIDTARGGGQVLSSNTTSAQADYSPQGISAFNTNGFTFGTTTAELNNSSNTYTSWTWAKAPKFFDVVTWTGDGTGARTLSHNLGSVPGCIIVKRYEGDPQSWEVYHQSLGNTQGLHLDLTNAASTWSGYWNNTSPTATQFTVGSNKNSGGSPTSRYVAYLFAHNAGGFGLTGTDNVISCGSYVVSGGSATINLGYEPQFVLTKASSATGNWLLLDNMRQFDTGGATFLSANTTAAETGYSVSRKLTNTGFTLSGATDGTYIYIAIRRGPMKVPTSGTSVYYAETVAQTDIQQTSSVPFPTDLVHGFSMNGTNRVYVNQWWDRLRGIGTPSNTFTAGGLVLNSTTTAAETTVNSYLQLKADSQNITRGSSWNNTLYGNFIYHMFRRAPSTFDEVCWIGDGNNPRSLNHNLAVAPELIITKKRNSTSNWITGFDFASTTYKYFNLNDTGAAVSDTYASSPVYGGQPTASVFVVGNQGNMNISGDTYVTYMWATNAGVTKVGSYTGNGSSQTINCGFTGGSRFVLIKRTNSSGDSYVWDSARGIVSGNDPHLSLNTTAAEVTTDDTIDTDSTGFIVNQVSATNCNVNGASYIFLSYA